MGERSGPESVLGLLLATAVAHGLPARADDEISARTYGNIRGRLGVVTAFDSQLGDPLPQNVVDYENHLLAGAEVSRPEHYKVVIEAKGWYRLVSQRPQPGQPFLLVNGEHAKGQLEVDAGDAYVDLYSRYVDLRIGNQTFSWGSNALFAPSDALNPPDLRQGGIFADPADAKLPVLAVSARASVGPFELIGAYVPVFQPARYDVIGQNDALLQPGILPYFPVPNLGPLLDPSVEGYRQAALVETERPPAVPQDGDAGLRVRTKAGVATISGTFLYAHEAVPRVWMDPDLATLAREVANGQSPDLGTLAAVGAKLAAGEKLYVGDHPRYVLLGLDASFLLGPLELDVDVGYKPKRTEYLQDLSPVTRSSLTTVVGLSDARGGDLILSLTYGALLVFGMNPGERLFLFESPGIDASQPRTALVHGMVGLAGYRLLGGDLEVEARGAMEFNQGSFAIGPRAKYRLNDYLSLAAGAEFWKGPALSPFGYFWRNNDVFVEARLDW